MLYARGGICFGSESGVTSLLATPGSWPPFFQRSPSATPFRSLPPTETNISPRYMHSIMEKWDLRFRPHTSPNQLFICVHLRTPVVLANAPPGSTCARKLNFYPARVQHCQRWR